MDTIRVRVGLGRAGDYLQITARKRTSLAARAGGYMKRERLLRDYGVDMDT